MGLACTVSKSIAEESHNTDMKKDESEDTVEFAFNSKSQGTIDKKKKATRGEKKKKKKATKQADTLAVAEVAPHVDRLERVIACMLEPDAKIRQKMLRPLFDGYASTADFPGIVFIDDLMDMYPDALIILNQRNDAEAWVTSFSNALMFFVSLDLLMESNACIESESWLADMSQRLPCSTPSNITG